MDSRLPAGRLSWNDRVGRELQSRFIIDNLYHRHKLGCPRNFSLINHRDGGFFDIEALRTPSGNGLGAFIFYERFKLIIHLNRNLAILVCYIPLKFTDRCNNTFRWQMKKLLDKMLFFTPQAIDNPNFSFNFI